MVLHISWPNARYAPGLRSSQGKPFCERILKSQVLFTFPSKYLYISTKQVSIEGEFWYSTHMFFQSYDFWLDSRSYNFWGSRFVEFQLKSCCNQAVRSLPDVAFVIPRIISYVFRRSKSESKQRGFAENNGFVEQSSARRRTFTYKLKQRLYTSIMGPVYCIEHGIY